MRSFQICGAHIRLGELVQEQFTPLGNDHSVKATFPLRISLSNLFFLRVRENRLQESSRQTMTNGHSSHSVNADLIGRKCHITILVQLVLP